MKAPLYAASGFDEYWLVNVPAQTVEVFREPSPEGYRRVTTAERGSVLSPLAFAEVEVPVGALFE